MTIQDLIDRLQQVDDKSKAVILHTAWVDIEGDYCGTDDYDIDYDDIKETADAFIIEGCVDVW